MLVAINTFSLQGPPNHYPLPHPPLYLPPPIMAQKQKEQWQYKSRSRRTIGELNSEVEGQLVF